MVMDMVVIAVTDAVWTALIVTSGGIASALLVGWQLNRQRKQTVKDKAEDRKREDEVATEKLRSEKEVADTAAAAAAILLEGTQEVARLAAVDSSKSKVPTEEATPVVLFYPNGERQDVVLSGVPRAGERIRLRNGRGDAALVVSAVVWMEATLPPPNPSVIVVVRPETEREESQSVTVPPSTL